MEEEGLQGEFLGKEEGKRVGIRDQRAVDILNYLRSNGEYCGRR